MIDNNIYTLDRPEHQVVYPRQHVGWCRRLQ